LINKKQDDAFPSPVNDLPIFPVYSTMTNLSTSRSSSAESSCHKYHLTPPLADTASSDTLVRQSDSQHIFEHIRPSDTNKRWTS
jgi:hypothetical protein